MEGQQQQGEEVVIVGAGAPSLALACLLQEKGIGVLLVDARRNIEIIPRGLTLQPNGLGALEQLGVFDQVNRLGKPVQVFEIRDWTGELLLNADYGLLGDPHNYLMTINGTELEGILRSRAQKQGARFLQGARFKSLLRDENSRATGVLVETERGELSIPARLVVGADGMQSRIRSEIGSTVKDHKYEDSFIVGLVGPVQGLDGRARQYQAPEHMLGVMPLGGNVATFVHHCVGKRSFDQVKEAGLGQFRKEVISTAPELEMAFSNLENWNRFGFFKPSYIRVDRWVDNGVVLLGDSAHTLHPHSGQGLNLSLGDAVSLARIVQEAHDSNDYSVRKLQSYQTERKPISDVVGEHAHYSATYALSTNWLVQRLNRRAMRRLQKNRKLLKTTLEITAGIFKEKPSLVKLARIGGILP